MEEEDWKVIGLPIEGLYRRSRREMKNQVNDMNQVMNGIKWIHKTSLKSTIIKKTKKSNEKPEEMKENGGNGRKEVERKLDVVVGRLKGIKRKIEETGLSENLILKKFKRRLLYFKANSIKNKEISLDSGSTLEELRNYRMISDYFMRNHYSASFHSLLQGCDNFKCQLDGTTTDLNDSSVITLGDLVDFEKDFFDERNFALDSLRFENNPQPAIDWCISNRSLLLRHSQSPPSPLLPRSRSISESGVSSSRSNHSLELQLRIQQLVVFLKNGLMDDDNHLLVPDSIDHLRNHIAPLVCKPSSLSSSPSSSRSKLKSRSHSTPPLPSQQQKKHSNSDPLSSSSLVLIGKALGALAASCDGDMSDLESRFAGRYADLLDDKRWKMLADQFESEWFELNGIEPVSPLETHLFAGLTALKLPQCIENEMVDDGETNIHPHSGRGQSRNCPCCCDTEVQELAKSVPIARRVSSALVCRISGEVMDEENPPFVLPNGEAYSRKALKMIGDANGGKVTCPKTGDTFDFDSLRRAYVL